MSTERFILEVLEQISHPLHTGSLRGYLEHLNEYPGGFKLNVPLTKRLTSIVLFCVELYGKYVAEYLTSFKSIIFKLVSISGFFLGFSGMIALSFDLFRFSTIHIKNVYFVFTKVYAIQIVLLSSFWHLFRGNKKNVLRSRIDTFETDTRHLLLGTLFFTSSVFLFPTVTLYYSFCLFFTAMVYLIQSTIWLCFVFVREFPFYGTFLFFMDPKTMPKGLIFVVPETPMSTTKIEYDGDSCGSEKNTKPRSLMSLLFQEEVSDNKLARKRSKSKIKDKSGDILSYGSRTNTTEPNVLRKRKTERKDGKTGKHEMKPQMENKNLTIGIKIETFE